MFPSFDTRNFGASGPAGQESGHLTYDGKKNIDVSQVPAHKSVP